MTKENAGAGRRNTHRGVVFAFALLAILVTASAMEFMRPWLFAADPRGMSHLYASLDLIDLPILLASLAQKPTWASTFSWWVTSWCPGSFVHFWRPLTVQTFWLEKHFFTLDRYDRWLWLSFAVHLITIGLYGGFVFLLSRRRDVAFFAVALYAVWRPPVVSSLGWARVMPSSVVLDAWKNQPDLFADCFVFAALICALKGRYWLGIACAFAAVAFKESGWMAFILPVVILAAAGRLRSVPASVYWGAAFAAAVLIVLRAAAGPEVFQGYHQGANKHWFDRFYSADCGIYLGMPLIQPSAWIVGHAVFAAAWLRGRGRIAASWAAFAGLFLCALVLDMVMMQMPITASLAEYFDPMLLSYRVPVIVEVYLWVSGALLIWKKPDLRSLVVIALLCEAVTTLPYVAAAQVLAHALHQAYAFQCLFVAVMFAAFWERWRSLPALARLGARWGGPAPLVTPGVS